MTRDVNVRQFRSPQSFDRFPIVKSIKHLQPNLIINWEYTGSMASSLRAFQITLRTAARANSASLRNQSPEFFSTAPHVTYTSSPPVTVDTSPPVMTDRLPNNDRERNALYDDEESRTMSNITSIVLH